MRSFKEQVNRDIANVFHNVNEFADGTSVIYSGKEYNIPVVIDSEGAKDRKRPSNDKADGIFIADLTVYISFYDLKIVPNKNTKITIDGTDYNIAKVAFDMGEITLYLEEFNE